MSVNLEVWQMVVASIFGYFMMIGAVWGYYGWNRVFTDEGPNGGPFFAGVLWPISIIIGCGYFLSQALAKAIKDKNIGL